MSDLISHLLVGDEKNCAAVTNCDVGFHSPVYRLTLENVSALNSPSQILRLYLIHKLGLSYNMWGVGDSSCDLTTSFSPGDVLELLGFIRRLADGANCEKAVHFSQ